MYRNTNTRWKGCLFAAFYLLIMSILGYYLRVYGIVLEYHIKDIAVLTLIIFTFTLFNTEILPIRYSATLLGIMFTFSFIRVDQTSVSFALVTTSLVSMIAILIFFAAGGRIRQT